MMRVAIIHHQFKLKGGMETYLLNLINGFNDQKDTVGVHVYKRTRITDSPPCDVQRTNLAWLPRTWRKFWFGSQISKQKVMQSYDLRISLMRSFHQEVIVCGGTHLGFLQHTKRHPSLLDKLEIAYENKSYQTSSKIIAHSHLLKDELTELYQVPADKIIMLFPPINTQKFHQESHVNQPVLRKKFNIHPTKKTLLFPSTGHKRKGFFQVIESLKLLPKNEFQLIVAGNPPDRNLHSDINYVGFVEDMASLYRACDVTLLPSLYEPFGLAVIESIQCGTPVIISKFVGAKHLISENEGIVLEDLAPATIAQSIMQSTTKKFNIKPNFAEHHNLTVEAHIKKIKEMHSTPYCLGEI